MWSHGWDDLVNAMMRAIDGQEGIREPTRTYS